ncbi:MAG: T9SS type A sorting domain-containing protein [Bacteroidota bacterium]
MKKIYLLASTLLIAITTTKAQLSLTKPANDPVYGDVFNRKEYDSVGVVPKNTGTNQVWNFSSYTQNSNVLNTTFTTVATATNGASYLGATIVEMDGAGANTYYKSTATGYELVGAENTALSYNYTNTAMGWAWPTAYGYANTDTYSGSASATGGTSGTSIGTVTTTASGTGTLILPGGLTLNNVLQLTIRNEFTLNYLSGAFVLNIKALDYNYFHASQKMPVLTVNYSSVSGSSTSSQAKIRVNNFVITGINDFNMDATFTIFPNPAKDFINVKLNNQNKNECKIEIINSIGQITETLSLGNDPEISNNISISNLSSGIYFIKTTLGDKSSVRKLIKE